MTNYKRAVFKRKKFKDVPEFDRPREKMLRRGPGALSVLELMAVILGSGIPGKDVYQVAAEIVRLVEKNFQELSVRKLLEVEGIGKAKACQIMAAIEFSRRYLVEDDIRIISEEDVLGMVTELRDKRQEYFLTLTLDGGNYLIQKRVVFVGTINESLNHPREIFSDAIADRAAFIILVHNHPSRDVFPSDNDIVVTRRLLEVSSIVGIDILDHIIVTKTESFSFKKSGMLRN